MTSAIFCFIRDCLKIWINDLLRLLGYRRYGLIKSEFLKKEVIFHLPSFSLEHIQIIERIAPHYVLQPDEESRNFFEKVQNACCWAENKVLYPYLSLVSLPQYILEIGPGIGRSVIFFKRYYHWDNAHFHLYEGAGSTTLYTLNGPRTSFSFCGSFQVLSDMLQQNGVTQFTIFNASQYSSLDSLPCQYDIIYSFFSVGYHWRLEYYFEEIEKLMHLKSLAVFQVSNYFKPFKKLSNYYFKILHYPSVHLGKRNHQMIILSKSKLPGDLMI